MPLAHSYELNKFKFQKPPSCLTWVSQASGRQALVSAPNALPRNDAWQRLSHRSSPTSAAPCAALAFAAVGNMSRICGAQRCTAPPKCQTRFCNLFLAQLIKNQLSVSTRVAECEIVKMRNAKWKNCKIQMHFCHFIYF